MKSILFPALLFGSVVSVTAADYSWQGLDTSLGGSGTWSAAANPTSWNPNGSPGSADNVTFGSTSTGLVTVNSAGSRSA